MANIKLYRNCEIREEKNFAVDDIERYLRDLVPVKEFEDTQYIKQGLDIEVKVKLDQTYLDREWTNMFNYCRIENGGGDDNCCYYFIRDKKWISKEAIKLVLHMDVINTYKDQVKLTNKTTIQREHKDRFINTNISQKVTYTETNSDEWEWGTRAGELVGFYSLDLSQEQFVGRDVTVTIRETRQPHKIALFEYDWDKDFAELKVTAYVQGEQSPIPDVEVEITVVPSSIVENMLIRKIDRVQEGFDTTLFRDNEYGDKILLESKKDGVNPDWNSTYLIYKTANEYQSSNPDAFVYNNAINCFLTTDEGLERKAGTFARVNASDLPDTTPINCRAVLFPVGAEGKQTPNSFIYDYPNPQAGLKIQVVGENGNTVDIGIEKVNERRNKQKCLYILNQSGRIWVFPAKLKRDNFRDNNEGLFNHGVMMGSYISFVGCSKVDVYKTSGDCQANLNTYDLFSPDRKGSLDMTVTGTTTTETSKPFREIDRTDQKLIKIIKLPYNPFDNWYVNHLIWDDAERMYRLSNVILNESGISKQIFLLPYDKTTDKFWTDGTDLGMSTNFIIKNPELSTTKLRDDYYESKLYHSDFCYNKVVYDSFNFVIKNELVTLNGLDSVDIEYWDYLDIKYVISTAVSSKFLFDFTDYFPTGYNQSKNKSDYYLTTEDYPNLMVVNRNLEVPIYNNYYMNYLKNGYNYDVKNKQTSQVASGIGVALGAAQIGFGIAANFIPGLGQVASATTIASGVATIAGSITGAVVNSIQADRALQQKLEQAKNQGASVQGADDIALLSYLADNNKAKMVRYQVSDITRNRIADLFYYCGYKCDYQDVPDTTSRYWFNFVQCNPVYDEGHWIAKMSKDCLDELSTKYGEGITFLHGHYNVEDDETEYDFKQVKENWETWLIA